MKKWLITLIGLTVALAAITSGGFALASNENDGIPSGGLYPLPIVDNSCGPMAVVA